MPLRLLIPFCLVFFLPGSFQILRADTLFLKNGEKIEDVQITGQTASHVDYREERNGPIRRLPKADLGRLTYGPVDWEMKRIKKEKEKLQEEQKALEAMQARRDDPQRILSGANEKLRRVQTALDEKRGAGRSDLARACNTESIDQERRIIEQNQSKLKADIQLAIEGDEQRIKQELNRLEKSLLELEKKEKAALQACKGLDSVPLQLSAGEAARLQQELRAIRADLERAEGNIKKERDLGKDSARLGHSSTALERAEWQHRYRTYQERQRGALWRNLLMPGWGHSYQGATNRGFFWMGAAATSLGLLYAANQQVVDRTRRYLDPVPLLMLQPIEGSDHLLGQYIYGQRAAKLKAAQNQYQNAALIMAGVWVGSLIDLTFIPVAAAPAGGRTALQSWEMQVSWSLRF